MKPKQDCTKCLFKPPCLVCSPTDKELVRPHDLEMRKYSMGYLGLPFLGRRNGYAALHGRAVSTTGRGHE